MRGDRGPGGAAQAPRTGSGCSPPPACPPEQWKSARTTNAIERLNEAFRRRIKTQAVLPCAETVPMLFRALLAPGQIQMRKIDGRQTLGQPVAPMPLDQAA